jgi:hypothetical protein
MLRWRLLTAAVAIPFLLWLIYRGPVWFLNGFVLAVTYIALRGMPRWRARGARGNNGRDVERHDDRSDYGARQLRRNDLGRHRDLSFRGLDRTLATAKTWRRA